MPDMVDDLHEIKSLIGHNTALLRLNDYIRGHQTDTNVDEVCRGANFNTDALPWRTAISSLYSSIALVSEFMKKRRDDIDSLDPNFTLALWSISQCYEHDGNGNRQTGTIALKDIIRRLRNSISHGRYELTKPDPEIRSWTIIFKDESTGTGPRKCFQIEIMVMNFLNFLEVMKRSFNTRYP